LRKLRDYYHWKKSNIDKNDSSQVDAAASFENELICETFRLIRTDFNRMNRNKMIEYYSKKSMKDFKKNKLFWKLYAPSIKVNSDKTNFNKIVLEENGILITNPVEVGNNFNQFFTNIKPNAFQPDDVCNKFIADNFKLLKENNLIKTSEFKFRQTTPAIVSKLLKNLDESKGAGVTGIPSKVLKHSHEELAPILASIFNQCILTGIIPNEFKEALVKPLFKNKGSPLDNNNYRGISTLPPIGKIFEKLLATQITIYTDNTFI